VNEPSTFRAPLQSWAVRNLHNFACMACTVVQSSCDSVHEWEARGQKPAEPGTVPRVHLQVLSECIFANQITATARVWPLPCFLPNTGLLKLTGFTLTTGQDLISILGKVSLMGSKLDSLMEFPLA
jgi:hypothetical protein